MKKIVLTATKNDETRKLIKFLESMFSEISYNFLHSILRKKDVKVNDKRTNNPQLILHENDIITIFGLDETDLTLKNIQDVEITFEKVYEDENILVVDKPYGLTVHDGIDNLDNQVLKYLEFSKNSSFTPSHIGRLDKETSGLMLYAKNYQTLKYLNQNKNKILKKYELITDLDNDLVARVWLVHDETTQRMKVITKQQIKNYHNAKMAITKFKVFQSGYATAILETGRKHQIRATLAYLNHPILGDKKYGGENFYRLCLHCYELVFLELDGELDYLNKKIIKSNKSIKEEKWKK